MTSDKDITQKLLDSPQAADLLRLADSYMGLYNKLGRRFILPEQHRELKPLIDKFAGDLPRFVEYVRGLRNTSEPRSNTYISLHEFYRTLRIRAVQQERRDRARLALVWLEKHYPKATTEQKLKWMRKLEQRWGRERMAAMDDARRKTKKVHLSTFEREEVLDDFWRGVDTDIKKGDLPPL